MNKYDNNILVREISKKYEIGDIVEKEVTPRPPAYPVASFFAASTAKVHLPRCKPSFFYGIIDESTA